MQNFADYDGLGLAELVRNRDATPSELLEATIERIERHNPKLNAVVHKAYDEARATAAGALPDGPYWLTLAVNFRLAREMQKLRL